MPTMHFSKRSHIPIALLAFCLLPPIASAAFSPIEQTMSSRQSIRNFTNDSISSQQLLEVLKNSYGTWGNHRSVPRIGNNYSLTIYPVNDTGSYRYIPESNSLIVHDLSVNKTTIAHDFIQPYPPTSNVILVIVWNQTKMNNQYFASAEAGCLVQNVYLAAVSLDLGTTCVSLIDSQGLRTDLNLPITIIPILGMPLGYPTSPYPSASPNYGTMTGNIPPVQYNQLSFTDALNNILYAQNWSPGNLSLQELSQLLWAAYGYSNVTTGGSYHRTTPSAYGIYPLAIHVSNITGTYQYVAETHSVTAVQLGDKRLDIANACGGQVWAANAPAIFWLTYNSSYNGGNTGDGGAVSHMNIEVDAGCVVQQLLLEASAWNLSANIVSNGFEEWNGTAAEGLRNILGLAPSLVPLYIVPLGHKAAYNLNLRVKDWDLTDSIQGAQVYKDSEWKISDGNGWANWTDVSGTVAIKVKWFESWVNGTFTITMDEDKTIDVRCNIFDTLITCVEERQQSLLQYVNVTVLTGENKINSGITGADGKTYLVNVPNSTLTFLAYDGNDNLIANDTRTITSEEQQETIICDRNYQTSQITWEINEVWIQSSLFLLSLIPILLMTSRTTRLKQQIKTKSRNYQKKRR